jgi:hypothetical protein
MCELEKTRGAIDTVQYQFFILPDWSDSESAIICKTHHSLTDGLGYATIMLAIQDKEYDPKELPGMKPISCFYQLILYVLSPYLIV